MKRLAVIEKLQNFDGMISSLREIGLEVTIYAVTPIPLFRKLRGIQVATAKIYI
jgi:hypothetical protein